MLPANWKVFLNMVDISDKVADITNISAELDLDDPIVFNTSEARMIINYPLPDDLLFRGEVSVFADSVLIYKGKILSIKKNLKRRIADVIVSDITQEMRNKPLDNFGLAKRVRLSRVGDTESGEYPFTSVLSPVSSGSVENGRVGRESFDSGVVEFPDKANNDDPINFGFVDDSKIELIALGDGYIYRTTERLSSLRIRAQGDVNIFCPIHLRFDTTPPTTDNITTKGNLLDSDTPPNSQAGSVSLDAEINNPIPSGSYFWFYPQQRDPEVSSSVVISNRRIILDFGAGAISPLIVVDSFLSEGDLNPLHISYDENTLRSEGGTLGYNPDITLKSPYRNKSPVFIIKKILEYYNITNSNISIDLFTLEDYYFSTNGRVGYDVESEYDENTPLAEGVETNIFWTGRVTDFLVDNKKFYFLYSSRIDDPKARSKIIKYDPIDDSYEIVHERESHAEYWKFDKDGDIFYILGTTRSSILANLPLLGAYDPTETDPKTTIFQVENDVETIYIASNNTHRPVVGMYYQLGFPIDGANNNVRRGILPDTRKGFIFQDNSLYYLYANRLTYGVAKSTAAGSAISFLTLPLDDYYNHLGADFTIDKNILYCGAVFQREIRATREIYKKSL